MTLLVDPEQNNVKDIFEIQPDGAKNAILPLMVSKLLIPGKTRFSNVPLELEDVKTMIDILTSVGLNCYVDENDLIIDNQGISNLHI